MNKKFSVKNYVDSHIDVMRILDIKQVEDAIKTIKGIFLKKKIIAVCGNGGSAQTASHYITDWNKMINIHTKKKFLGVCLSDNVGLITAYANDISYQEIYAEQVKNLLSAGDLLIVISGSGNSENVIRAIKAAKKMNVKTLAICGYDGGKIKKLADQSVWIQSFDMQICEDAHLAFGHMVMKNICNLKIK